MSSQSTYDRIDILKSIPTELMEVDAILEDIEGFRIILTDSKGECKLRIRFNDPLCVSFCSEGILLKDIKTRLPTTHGPLFIALESEYLERFKKDSLSLYPAAQHYLIVSQEHEIHVICQDPPLADWLLEPVNIS